MSSKMDLEHEKPEVVDEQQPTVKKVRLAVEAVSVLDEKEGDATEAQADATVGSNDEDTSAENSPKADDDDDDDERSSAQNAAVASADEQAAPSAARDPVDTTPAAAETPAVVAVPNTTGSAFGGFAAFSSTSGFSAFPASGSSSSGFGAFASSGSSGGFASFQSADAASFSSFASSSSSLTSDATDGGGGFGTTASASESVEFGSSAVKKTESTFVPALTDAEIANGEEGELILIEKRAKLFKLADADYTEVGIGPLRVLKAAAAAAAAASATSKSSVRIVMRRESYARGPGTKLLLNARLNACLACIEKTEKAMLLTVVESVSDNDDGMAEHERGSESSDATTTTQTVGSSENAAAATTAATPKIMPSTYLVRFGSSDDFQSVLARIRPWLPSTTASS